ncbi:MAG: hypothetical protein ABSG16_22765 [Candidatus Acidiferrum sp.]|jgi:hypothetical protein
MGSFSFAASASRGQWLSQGRWFRRTSLLLLALAGTLLLLPACRAQAADVSGRYQCVQVKVQEKIVACTAAPLILKNDGRFELRGWEGSYLVNGQWVELSDALLKARARIEPGHKIVLRYYGDKGLVEMIYERRVANLGKTSLG